MNSVYTTLILENANMKKNVGEVDPADRKELGHNPSCGDELTLSLRMNGETIEDLKYIGEGCAISRASTSLMIDTVKGKTREEALTIIDSYLNMIRGEELTKEEKKALKDARIFESIKNLPARVKCATLSWHTMKNILNES